MGKSINSTGKSSELPVVTGHEKDVSELVTQKILMDRAKGAFDLVRENLEKLAANLRNKLESKGVFATKVELRGEKASLALSFGDRLSAIPMEDAEPLRAEIGAEHFDALFGQVETVKIRADKIDEFVAMLQKQGIDIEAYVERTNDVRPLPDFRQKRFEQRALMSTDANGLLDATIEKLQYQPTLSGIQKFLAAEVADQQIKKAS